MSQWLRIAEEGKAVRGGGIRLEEGDMGGTYIIRNLNAAPDAAEEQSTVLIQTDWDYPGVASSFGMPGHEHGSTDGTVDCPECGKTASEMIQEARAWLDEHIGAEAEDPGYFGG